MATSLSPSIPRFQVFVGFHTDVGRHRQKNEDALLEVAGPLGYLIAVADGMGGHDFGERAAAIAVETLHRVTGEEQGEPRRVLERGFAEANAKIYEEAQELGSTMGATCVAALISKGSMHIAHAGDARAYLLRASVLYPLTRDHSFVQEIADAKGPVVAGNLPTNFSHIVSRSLGTQAAVEVALREPVVLCAGDVILLCSDGLTNMVDEARLRATLAGTTPREAAKRLVDMANEAGGLDNITVIVARIDSEAFAPDTQLLGISDLRGMFVRTADGQLHAIVDGVIDAATWTLSALVIDLRNAQKGVRCTLSLAEMGPVVFGKQAIQIPQTTEALVEMGQQGLWRSDAKLSQPPPRLA